MSFSHNEPCALVVGLCSHGLAISRSLSKAGVEVHAFEANSSIPGFQTKSATIHRVDSIKDPSLIEDLLAFRERMPVAKSIVLFPTNDNNVRVIAEHIDRLKDAFIISWAHCSDSIRKLLLKSNIEKRCLEVGLNYPVSLVLNQRNELETGVSKLRPPFIIKPANPQSGFKAFKCSSVFELEKIVEQYPTDYPFIIQEWVEGTDKDLFFGALYLDHGRPIANFVGNKLESYPPTLGQTTVAISVDEPEVMVLTEKFFDGLKLSGPVSLELKRDTLGQYWVIEPTIGRTDFWVGLCIESGCDLPVIEFCSVTGTHTDQPVYHAQQQRPVIWFDSERDILAPLKFLSFYASLSQTRRRPSFSYLNKADLKPCIHSLMKTSVRVSRSLLSRVQKTSDRYARHSISVYDEIEAVPKKYLSLLDKKEQESIFLGYDWFSNFCSTVANSPAKAVRIYCLEDDQGSPLALLPMWHIESEFHGLTVRKLSSLSNYYSPIFDVILDPEVISNEEAYRIFLNHFWREAHDWDLIDIYPLCAEAKDNILKNDRLKRISFDYYLTQNYYHTGFKSFEKYLSARPSRVINTLKRKNKKLERMEGFSVRIISEPDEIAAKLKDYHRVYKHSWKIDEPYPRFIDGLADLCAKYGWLRLGFIEVEKRIVAVQFWMIANGSAYIYKLAYDKEYMSCSPGTVLTAKMIERAIDVDGVKKIDFLTGQDSFKKEWMDSSKSLYGVHIVNYRTVKGIAVLVINELSKIRRYLVRLKKSIQSKPL